MATKILNQIHITKDYLCISFFIGKKQMYFQKITKNIYRAGFVRTYLKGSEKISKNTIVKNYKERKKGEHATKYKHKT